MSGLWSVISGAPNATTLLENTIIVHNSEDLSVRDCSGVLTSLGHNLIGAPSCLITLQPSDLVGDAGWVRSKMTARLEMRIFRCCPAVKRSMLPIRRPAPRKTRSASRADHDAISALSSSVEGAP